MQRCLEKEPLFLELHRAVLDLIAPVSALMSTTGSSKHRVDLDNNNDGWRFVVPRQRTF